MRQSLKILRAGLRHDSGGPTEHLEAKRMAEGKDSESAGFDYQHVAKEAVALTFKHLHRKSSTPAWKSGKGEIGVFLQGNNDVTPWRFKIRAADSNNLQILPHILKGHKVADIMAILGSIDVTAGIGGSPDSRPHCDLSSIHLLAVIHTGQLEIKRDTPIKPSNKTLEAEANQQQTPPLFLSSWLRHKVLTSRVPDSGAVWIVINRYMIPKRDH